MADSCIVLGYRGGISAVNTCRRVVNFIYTRYPTWGRSGAFTAEKHRFSHRKAALLASKSTASLLPLHKQADYLTVSKTDKNIANFSYILPDVCMPFAVIPRRSCRPPWSRRSRSRRSCGSVFRWSFRHHLDTMSDLAVVFPFLRPSSLIHLCFKKKTRCFRAAWRGS